MTRHDQDLPGHDHAIGKRYDHVPSPVEEPNGLVHCRICHRALTPVEHLRDAVPHWRHKQRRRSQTCSRRKKR